MIHRSLRMKFKEFFFILSAFFFFFSGPICFLSEGYPSMSAVLVQISAEVAIYNDNFLLPSYEL